MHKSYLIFSEVYIGCVNTGQHVVSYISIFEEETLSML